MTNGRFRALAAIAALGSFGLASCDYEELCDFASDWCAPKEGDVPLTITFNVTPDETWNSGLDVTLSADARRHTEIDQEDRFGYVLYPGTYPRVAGQKLDFTLPDVTVGESIIVQAYICAEGTTACIPSEGSNPPICYTTVPILPGLKPSCQPVFTWTGNVTCTADCI